MSGIPTGWKKSRRSASSNCVEVRLTDTGMIQVRDSKHPEGLVLGFTRAQWSIFIDVAKSDEFSP
ncbi:MAG TPA: DUF397 domain-containing protein [Micromonosporaceae bacterium]|nr:DUF397 domain-containing protein [Micromonosporaceae bacterium]